MDALSSRPRGTRLGKGVIQWILDDNADWPQISIVRLRTDPAGVDGPALLNVYYGSSSACRDQLWPILMPRKAEAIHSLLDFYHNPLRQQAFTVLFRYVGKPADWIT